MEHCVWPVSLQEHDYCRRRERQPRSQDKAEGYWKQVLRAPLTQQPSPEPLKPRKRPAPLPCTEPQPPAPRPERDYSRNAAVLPPFFGPLPPCPAAEPTPLPAERDQPLMIHGHTVEQYQGIYHSVVDNMLVDEDGRPRTYTADLGRQIKQRLWEALFRPVLTMEETSCGLLKVQESSSSEVCAPHIDVDISGEPDLQPPRKRHRRH